MNTNKIDNLMKSCFLPKIQMDNQYIHDLSYSNIIKFNPFLKSIGYKFKLGLGEWEKYGYLALCDHQARTIQLKLPDTFLFGHELIHAYRDFKRLFTNEKAIEYWYNREEKKTYYAEEVICDLGSLYISSIIDPNIIHSRIAWVKFLCEQHHGMCLTKDEYRLAKCHARQMAIDILRESSLV